MNSVIQFSGGRTSAYLLWLLLQANGGKLPDDWVVCFQNTGKEREETLVFVNEVGTRWNVPVYWMEFDDYFDVNEYIKPDGTYRTRKLRSGVRYKLVDFHSASRNGEPFEKVFAMTASFRAVVKNAPPLLPNPVQRMCTAFMKQKTCRTFLLDLGWDEWDIYMGFRADEANRRAKMQDWLSSNEYLQTPLIDGGVTKQDVNEFWRSQPFDLMLDPAGDQGNCDLCFMKATGKLINIIRQDPSRVDWWKMMETRTGATFSKSKLSFHQLDAMIKADDPKLQKYIDNTSDKTVDCFCGE